MEESKTCLGLNKRTGLQCKKYALPKKLYCLFHDTDKTSINQRKAISFKGGKKPKSLITKLKGFNGKDSADFAEAIKTILNQMLSQGLIRSLKDVAVFRSLLDSYTKLEQASLIPVKMREIEKMLADNQAKEVVHKPAVVKPAGLVS